MNQNFQAAFQAFFFKLITSSAYARHCIIFATYEYNGIKIDQRDWIIDFPRHSHQSIWLNKAARTIWCCGSAGNIGYLVVSSWTSRFREPIDEIFSRGKKAAFLGFGCEIYPILDGGYWRVQGLILEWSHPKDFPPDYNKKHQNFIFNDYFFVIFLG